MDNKVKFWIGVVSKEHVIRGVDGQFAQVCHGKGTPLKRIKHEDWLIYYSPVYSMHINNTDNKLQAFTAIGRVKDDEIYQVEMFADFHPFRRNINFLKCNEVKIHSLNLNFKTGNWGLLLRRGLFEISENDFNVIYEAMCS